MPYLVDDAGLGMEDSQLICAYLDSLDGKPRFHGPRSEPDWAYLRLEFMARSLCDGISVWSREMHRPASERSPTVLAHEVARSQRMADVFEGLVADPLMQRTPSMAPLFLEQLQPFRFKFGTCVGEKPCDVSAGMREALREPSPDGIVAVG